MTPDQPTTHPRLARPLCRRLLGKGARAAATLGSPAALAISELSKAVPQLLMDHLAVPELTLKPPFHSQNSHIYIYLHIYTIATSNRLYRSPICSKEPCPGSRSSRGLRAQSMPQSGLPASQRGGPPLDHSLARRTGSRHTVSRAPKTIET